MSFNIYKYHFSTHSIFEDLPVKEQKKLRADIKRMEVKKNKVIFKEGDYSKGIYILLKGKVKIYQTNKEGKPQIVYVYGENEIMGYRPLLCNETHPVTASTIEDCIISFIPNTSFIQVLDQSITLSRKIHENLAHEFNVWINTLTILSQQPAKERLAFVLMILNEKFRKEPGKTPVINISRRDMASYARITAETLARTFAVLRQQAIIKTDGRKLTILKPKKLLEFLDI